MQKHEYRFYERALYSITAEIVYIYDRCIKDLDRDRFEVDVLERNLCVFRVYMYGITELHTLSDDI